MTNAVGGFTTSTKTRPLIVAKLEEFIRNKIIKIRSSRAFDEFRTFVWNNGKPQAMRSYHDDIIMCGYNADFETKYREELSNARNFAWIFKG